MTAHSSITGSNVYEVKTDMHRQLKQSGTVDQLIAHVLGCSRAYLYAHPEQAVKSSDKRRLEKLLAESMKGVPVAYLTGKCEFFSLEFTVNPQVWIPREETELLADVVRKIAPYEGHVLELGTGSGAIAITLKEYSPDLTITATDINPEALNLARRNAGSRKIEFVLSDWFEALDGRRFDAIVSNPPYVARGDPELEANVAAYEPASALYAADNGVACLQTIIKQSPNYLVDCGQLALEHGHKQAEVVAAMMNVAGFEHVECLKDYSDLPRVSFGCLAPVA